VTQPARLSRFFVALSQPRAAFWIIASAMLLTAPCLFTRLTLDDHVLALKSRADTVVPGVPADPLWLFTFTTGDPAQNQLLMDQGVILPWWSDPRHLNSFFRPLSSLTHVFDFRVWPSWPAAMHLHSMLWYAAALWLLFGVYRSLDGGDPRLVGLSLLLFAWDDAHGATVGWIANRNALIAVALALPALTAHHRAVREGVRSAAWLGPLWFALGLCAGETAISIAGYLLAYALCLDTRPLLRRALSLAPYVALLLAHRVLYRAFHLGSFGSSAYHDPLREPFEFLIALGYNLPVLLSSELLLPLADTAFWGAPALRSSLWLLSAVGLAALWPVLKPWLARDPKARFWCVGLLLAAIPVSASLPGERLLLVLGIGASPLLARLCSQFAEQARAEQRPIVAALVVLHVVVAPLAMPLRAAALEPLARAIDRLDADLPRSHELPAQSLIIVNAPFTVMSSYAQLARAARGEVRPKRELMLASSSSEISVSRRGPRELRVELAEGFLRRPEETHYRADCMRKTDRVELHGVSIRVASRTSDGRPKAVDFAFAEPLESPRYLLRAYRDGHLVPWQPSAAGVVERFPAQDFFQLVAKELLR
jgi:hypothetical protein